MNTIANDGDKFKTQYTFWEILRDCIIEIPIIQRDYAQGRESVEAIRKELLTCIYNAVETRSVLDFDFVYGASETIVDKDGKTLNKLLPLDGQQRLTTFFLLHWYLAEKEGRMKMARQVLHHFSYSTRISSRDFCEMIVDLDYSPSREERVSHYIKNENKYFKVWDTDPTIKAMLTMLDDIHEMFFECGPCFDDLTSDSLALFTFSYLPMEHYSLTDDLYIKMNARGKALSTYENFKAKFIQHLKNNSLPFKHFEDSIDGQWVNLLWDYRSKDNTIDKQFMNLFCYITEMIFLQMEEPQNCDSPFKYGDIRKLVDYYDTEEKVSLLYNLLDLWSSRDEVKSYLGNVLSVERTQNKVRIFDGQPDIFSDLVLGNSVTIVNKILLYSIMMRLIAFGKNYEDAGMLDYVRVVRNILIKVRSFISTKCAFTSDFRFGRNGIPTTKFIYNFLVREEDPYRILLGKYIDEYGINIEVYRQEAAKAQVIYDKPELKTLIQGLEDLAIFRGSIFNILEYVTEYGDECLIEDLESLFVSDNSEEIFSAMLSVGNYGVKVGNTYLGDRVFFGNKTSWYEILTYQGDNNFSRILTDFISQYQNSDAECIGDALREIAEENIKGVELNDWRYCLIKYPSTFNDSFGISSSNVVFSFEGDGVNYRLHRMNGRTLNAIHLVPEYIAAVEQLEKQDAHVHAGQNSDDLGYIMLSPDPFIGIEMQKDGNPCAFGLFLTEECDDLLHKSIQEYTEKDKASLDRVERLVLMAETLASNFATS